MPAWGDIFEEIKEEAETQPSPFDTVRTKYLKQLTDHTGRDAILYSSGWTELEANSTKFSISEPDVHGFMQTIHGLEKSKLDLIIHSPGGSPEVAEQIVTYLRAKFDDIRMIVPQSAMSAATLMCCAANTVLMGHHSSLGPTDPQILLLTEAGRRWVAAQSIIDQFNEIDEKAQKGDEIFHYEPILSQYNPGLLQEAKRALSLSQSLAEDWAEEHMFDGNSNATALAQNLSQYLSTHDEFMSHSRRISKDQVEEEGMAVQSLEEDQHLQDLVLSIFHATMITHNRRNIAKIVENQHGDLFSLEVATG